MLKDDTRIQIDLYANLAIDKILLGPDDAEIQREQNAVFIDFPETLRAGRDYAIDFALFGHAAPRPAGLAASRSARTRPASRGSRPPAKVRAPASGGRTRISGATSPKGWSLASRSRAIW